MLRTVSLIEIIINVIFIHDSEILNRFKHVSNFIRYKAEDVFLSFNGGKDCTVVLHLVATFARLRNLDLPMCLYVSGDAFPEVRLQYLKSDIYLNYKVQIIVTDEESILQVEEFVRSAAVYYGFELIYREGPIRDALAAVLEQRPNLKACLLGTRKGDPGAHSLERFTLTDPGWPKLMRVCPILHWSYSQVKLLYDL